MRWTTALMFVVGSVSLVGATKASAAEPDPSSAAASAFREARIFLSQGRFDLACERFETSQKLHPSVGALLNIADCRERRGQLVSARAACLDARTLATSSGDSERAAFAETRAREIDDKTPRLRIDAPTDEPGTTVLRDGVALEAGAIGVASPLDPGPHHVEMRIGADVAFARDVALVAGAGIVVVKVPRSAPPHATTSAPHDAHEGARRPYGLVVAGTGGAALIAGAVLGVLAMNRWNDVESVCPARQCPSAGARDRVLGSKDAATDLALASTLAIVAGAVLLAGGLTFHFVGR